jgi:hypothetical protein
MRKRTLLSSRELTVLAGVDKYASWFHMRLLFAKPSKSRATSAMIPLEIRREFRRAVTR